MERGAGAPGSRSFNRDGTQSGDGCRAANRPLRSPGGDRDDTPGPSGAGHRRLAAAGSPPDIRPILARCRAEGSVLDGSEMIQIVPVLDASPRLRAYGRSVREASPAVASITEALPRFAELADRLRRALDASGAVTDDASPTLKRLRREIRDRRRPLASELERAFPGSDADRLFADRYVTLRHGRYVLPVRTEARSRVRGIVHDRSQSGQP